MPPHHSDRHKLPEGISRESWERLKRFRGSITEAFQLLLAERDTNDEPLACREHLGRIRVAKGMPLPVTIAAGHLYTASCSSVRYAVVTERDPETGERVQVRRPVGYDLTPLRAAQEIADRCEGKAVQRVHVKTEAVRSPDAVQAELVALLAAHPELASLVAGGLRESRPLAVIEGSAVPVEDGPQPVAVTEARSGE